MGRVHIKAGDAQIERWHVAAHDARMSFSAWAREALDAHLDADQGAIHTPAEVIEQMERESWESQREEPAAMGRGGGGRDRGESVSGPGPSPEPPLAAEGVPGGESPPAAAAPPLPQAKPRPKGAPLGEMLKGTISGPQSLRAVEAARRAQEREDAFSLVCPSRNEHVPGVRCPQCKGIR